MKDDELKKQEVVNAESEKQNVTTLNEKLDFSDLENVEGGTVKDFKDDEHLKSEGGNVRCWLRLLITVAVSPNNCIRSGIL